MMGNVLVKPGDLIVGDVDGVVAIPREHVDAVLTASEQREATERGILNRLRAGETTLSVFGLDR